MRTQRPLTDTDRLTQLRLASLRAFIGWEMIQNKHRQAVVLLIDNAALSARGDAYQR